MKTLFNGDIVQCVRTDFGSVWKSVRLPILYEFYTVADTVRVANENFYRIVFEEHLKYQESSVRYMHPDYGYLRYYKDYAFPVTHFKYITNNIQLEKQLNYILNPQT